MDKIILASGSPRRKELLNQIDIDFEVILSNVEEHTSETEPENIVKDLSAQKAKDVAAKVEDGRIVLGADTVVAVDGEILGKPSSKDDAFRMIKSLSGRQHSVYTGVTLIKKAAEDKIISFAEKTDVFVKEMSDDEIWTYISSGEPMDKAGAYGIQGKFAAFVEKIEGDYNNIVGLPIAKVYDMLKFLNSEIKLIASDIDGTLVRDGESKLNKELIEVIEKLYEKGIIFTAASGRSVVSQEKLFEPIRDKIYYISCNGTYVGRYGERLFCSYIKPEDVKEIIRDTRNYPDCTLFLNVDRGYYTDSKDQEVISWVENGYRETVYQVDDLLEVNENIIKACLYDPKHQAGDTGKDLIEKWKGKLSVVTAGTMWLDFFDKDASKGVAVSMLQEMLGISKEETIAFGDQQNDIEMLKQAEYSFAIGNAIPEVKKIAKYETDTNVNNGVLKVLKTLL